MVYTDAERTDKTSTSPLFFCQLQKFKKKKCKIGNVTVKNHCTNLGMVKTGIASG